MSNRYFYTIVLLLSLSLCSFLRAEDSISLSKSDYLQILDRLARLENKIDSVQKTDAQTGATKVVDAQTGATKVIDAQTGATIVKTTPDKQTTEKKDEPEKGKTTPKWIHNRLTIGGYGEAVMTRNFFSDHFNRYKDPAAYKNGRSNGQFDLPHVVINIGYDFGHGWSMGTEIEFEHGGTESAVEIDADEAGEYEAEVEKGGEVALEQFWINKKFFRELQIKMGEIVVPVGMTNSHHLPTEFFTAYRNEGEMRLFPCTWHQLGVELWGKNEYIGYQLQFLAGLDAERFSAPYFVHYGATSPYEFKLANGYAFAGRVDGYIPKTGLRLSVSGYVGNTIANTQYSGVYNSKYDKVKGTLLIGSFDFEWKKFGVIMRGNIDYAHLGNADEIWNLFQYLSKHKYQDGSPRKGTPVNSKALCGGVQLGYDIFHYIPKLHERQMQLIPFCVYEYYNPVYGKGINSVNYEYMDRHRVACGVNFYPIKEVVIKAEYSKRFLKGIYNNEPSFSLSVAYSGWFKF